MDLIGVFQDLGCRIAVSDHLMMSGKAITSQFVGESREDRLTQQSRASVIVCLRVRLHIKQMYLGIFDVNVPAE